MRQFLKIYVRFSISRLIIFLTFFVLNSTWCFRKKENVRQDRARRRIASLIINSCGTKSTSRRRLDDIHASIYIYIRLIYQIQYWRRIYVLNCQWLIPRMPPLPTPFHQTGFSATVAIMRIQADLKLYMTQREKM